MAASHRLWTTTILLLVVESSAFYIHRGYTLAQITVPQHNITELPERLGEWRGEIVTIDPQIAVATGAEVVKDRVYRHSLQPDIYLHCGLWTKPGSRAPHLPPTCYTGNGWEKLAQELVLVGNQSETQVTVALITWEREGDRMRTLHWYRRGEHSFYDWDGGCGVYRRFWGQTNRPAIEKVLLQTDHEDEGQSRKRLIAFAEEIHQWMQTTR